MKLILFLLLLISPCYACEYCIHDIDRSINIAYKNFEEQDANNEFYYGVILGMQISRQTVIENHQTLKEIK